MKPLLKRAIKSAAAVLGRENPHATRILTYHSIGHRRHEMTVSAEAFTQQIHWLKNHAQVITLAQAVAGKPGIAITFDDGFADNLYTAAPVIANLELPATVFMVAGRAGQYLDAEPDPEHGRLMTWDELRQLDAMGIEIGSHTLTHPHLSRLPPHQQREEISQSKLILEDQLGKAVSAFAYPYGSALDYTPDTMALVEEAAYALACSNRYGARAGESQFEVRRIWVDATDTTSSFIHKVTGKLDPLWLLDSAPAIRVRRFINTQKKGRIR